MSEKDKLIITPSFAGLTYANKIDFYVNENDCYLVLFVVDEASLPESHAVVYIPHTVALDLANQITATKDDLKSG